MRSTAAKRFSFSFSFSCALLVLSPAAACGDDAVATSDSATDPTSTDGTGTGTDSDSGSGSDSTLGTGTGTGTDSDSETGDDTSDIGPWPSFDERPCPTDSFLTYENFGAPFISSNCTGCHHSDLPDGERLDAPPSVNFDTIDLVRMQAAAIWSRSGDQNATMPPSGPPPPDDRTMLGEWLACGAPTASDLAN